MQVYSYEIALADLFRNARYTGRGQKSAQPKRSLQRMIELLDRLDNPQKQFQAIHVTGTKGKGSTCAFSESILRYLGYRTGLFTSPHLHSFRERIRVQGELMPRHTLVELMGRLAPHFDAIPELSIFDKITALAFQQFADEGVDWAVVEVGIGGRLDSTNILHPAVCGITRISMDHMYVLGSTLAEIAWEKAGIIKPGIPVYIAPQQAEAYAVLERAAHQRNSALTQVKPLAEMLLPLQGRHQRVNAAIASTMISYLAEQNYLHRDAVAVETGLKATRWPGRFELLPQPAQQTHGLLVDCAHNVDSLEILIETLHQFYLNRPLAFIFGVNQDKQLASMLNRISTVSSHLVLVNSRHPKAMPVGELAHSLAGQQGGQSCRPLTIARAQTMSDALALAEKMTPSGGLIVGTGSVFVAAELREAWNERFPGLFDRSDWVHEAFREPLLMPMVTPGQE